MCCLVLCADLSFFKSDFGSSLTYCVNNTERLEPELVQNICEGESTNDFLVETLPGFNFLPLGAKKNNVLTQIMSILRSQIIVEKVNMCSNDLI